MAPGSSPATQFGGKTCLLSACGPISRPRPGTVGGAGRVWVAAGLGLLSLCFPPAPQPSTPPGFSAGVAYRIQLLASPIITIFPATRRRGGRALPTPEGLSFSVFTLSPSNLGGGAETLRSLTFGFLCCPWGRPLLFSILGSIHGQNYPVLLRHPTSSVSRSKDCSHNTRVCLHISDPKGFGDPKRGLGGISPDFPHSALD